MHLQFSEMLRRYRNSKIHINSALISVYMQKTNLKRNDTCLLLDQLENGLLGTIHPLCIEDHIGSWETITKEFAKVLLDDPKCY